MSLFSGLEKYGLGKLDDIDVKEKKKEETKQAQRKPAPKPVPQVNETDMIFDKSYTCPVCDSKFRTKTIKTGKIHLISQDTDLRPRYKNIDSIKYDVVACPNCGYAALARFFASIMPSQAKLIKENITKNFTGLAKIDGAYTYDYALGNYQLALANAMVKRAKSSEKAYTCLKTAWLCRGKAESMDGSEPEYEKIIHELKEEEKSLMLKAYEGFKEAFTKENFPMCGMDELTVTYLVAELARRAGDYDESARYISRILTSRVASERIKDKARSIKELIDEDKKASGE